VGAAVINKNVRDPTHVLEFWREVATVEKELVTWPTWSDVQRPPPPSSNRPIEERGKIRTTAGESTRVVFPLARIGGLGLEGVRLRLTAKPFRRNDEVTATLEVSGGRNGVTIARIDAWPADPHGNINRDHRKILGIPALIRGSHVHRFEDNARLGVEAFSPQSNLPAARELDRDIQSFRQFLALVEAEFCITGLSDFPAPDGWEGLL
jgi:hypothetical protein